MTGAELNRLLIDVFRPDIWAMLERFPPPSGGRDPFPDDEPPEVLPPSPQRGPCRRNADPNVYRFVSPEGAEFLGTRRDFSAVNPGINPGALHDLVKGRSKSAKGWHCAGIYQQS